MEYWSILLSIMISVLGIHYLFRNYNFFKRHDVIHIPSVPILGNMTSVIFRRISFVDFTRKIYNFNPDAKYLGFYATTNPMFLLRDPEIIKSILLKNFDAFPNRRGFNNLNEPLFSNNLFSLHGQKWRDVRTLLSPSFTSSKMKMMFTLMSECAVDFANFLSTSIPGEKSDMDMKDVFTKYTNDVIATCAFGIKINSMQDPTNKFYVYGKKLVYFSGIRNIKFFFLRTFPTLGRILNVKLIDSHVSDFFKDIIRTTIATRDAENIIRSDMIQLMMDIRGKEGRRELNIDDMVAQAFVFFFAGFDTSSTAMSFVAYELAANPDVQIKLRQEIDKAVLGIHYLFRNYNFFKRHDVIHIPSVPILGNMTSVIFRRISFVDFTRKIYNFNPDAKYLGFYATTNPMFLLRDPEIIKSILLKNFDAFPNRRGFNNLNEPLFSNNLFSLHGQKWRDVRTLLSPSFTSSKMKMMFTLMSECAVDFANFLSTSIPGEKSDMDMKDVFTKYTNDVIATCAFGIKINSMQDPTNKFYVYGKKLVYFSGIRNIKFFFLRTFPTLGRILNVKLIDSHVSDFFKDIIRTTIATRDAENIIRSDMIQLMMDIRGPRMCIANRFATLEMKVLLFHLLARCELKPCAKTTLPLKFSKKGVMMPENGFWLKVQRRNNMHPVLESMLSTINP
ncbi:Cytochrome P450 9e2 [Camponotus floridanus]|uniref:Cytochrome P450 9e2 n=1 Tax=Camponotus floridanus TaxID=104421 RepID=E2AZV8_CAMFO|nr:Cytochrome P450 9e2 [Camponotus floridanus]